MEFRKYMGLFLLVCLISCVKPEKDSPARTLNSRISKIITSANDTVESTRFIYDLSGKITQIIDSSNKSSVKQFITITYTPGGHLSKIIYNGNNNPPDRIDTFTVNTNGQVQSSKTFFVASATLIFRDYSYDGSGRVITDSAVSNALSYTHYNYNTTGDLTEWKTYGPSPFTGVISLIGTVTTNFNNSPNPYKSLGLTYFFAKKDKVVLSEHQRISDSISSAYSSQYSYEYNASGEVKKITVMKGNYGVGKFIEIVYE